MIFFLWVVMLGLLQSVAQININFLGLMAIFAGLKKGPVWGLGAGIFIGSLSEILSSNAQGLNLMLYSGIGLGAGIIKQQIYYKQGFRQEIFFSFLGMLCFYAVYFVVTKKIQTDMLFTIIFSSLVSPLVFKALD